MDYTYKVGDKVFLKPKADITYNIEPNIGKEVTIVKIDYRDSFFPYKIKTISGNWFWVNLDDIGGYFKPLGLKI